ncbi:MAG: Hsp20/alpha crystallin family protein [Steroidobacteraceae bacterium]
MNIAIREPWGLLNRLSRDFDGLVSGAQPTDVAFIPPVDVREEAGRFVVQADLPGVTPEDIEVTAEKGVLTLRGERKAEKREANVGYERIERVSGSFTRRFALPENVQADAIKAKFTHGVLEVSIPKQPEVAAKRVPVEVH